jgi:flagellar biosynthetic protein FliR
MIALPTSQLSSVIELYGDQILVFLLVFTRLSGLVIAAPVVGSRSVPVRIRALLVFALTLLIAPLHWGTPIDTPHNLLELARLVSYEILVGSALGLGVMFLLLGLQVAGHVAGHMSGMALADVFDPTFDASIPMIAQLMDVVTILLFVAMGGHRIVLDALLDTFQWMPPGAVEISTDALTSMVAIMRESLILGVRAAAPMIVSLLMSILVMGLISRTLPQLNILAVGLSLNSIVMLATVAISLGAIAWMFQDAVVPILEEISTMFGRQ